VAATQNIDTDESNPIARLLMHLMAAFADNAEPAIMQSHGAKVELWPAFG
jgi:hypothetical protein